MRIHRVTNLPTSMLEHDDKIVSVVARRDYLLAFTERGRVYKIEFDYSEQWE
jgi:hypothetical protein